MDRKIGNFRLLIRPYSDIDVENKFQLIVMSLQDPLFNEWQVEVIDVADTEVEAEAAATLIIKLLQSQEMMVEDEQY